MEDKFETGSVCRLSVASKTKIPKPVSVPVSSRLTHHLLVPYALFLSHARVSSSPPRGP